MKRDGLILTALSALLLLAGCSKSETPQQPPQDGVIRLRAGVHATVGSKAAVGGAEPFTAQVCGWEASGATDLTKAPQWSNEQDFKVGSVDVTFDLNPLRYYNKNKEISTTICAWYPLGIPQNGQVAFENPNGDVDVMLAPAVTGSLSHAVDEPLVFTHRTALLCFRIVGHDWDPAEKITGITIRDIMLPTGLNLVDGALLTADPTNFALRNIPTEGVTPQAQAAEVGDEVMIAPTSGNVLYLDVQTTAKKYERIAVTTTDATYAAGTAYTATLTFDGFQGISIGSTIGTWDDGLSDGEIVD